VIVVGVLSFLADFAGWRIGLLPPSAAFSDLVLGSAGVYVRTLALGLSLFSLISFKVLLV